jgi:hypothetical protein
MIQSYNINNHLDNKTTTAAATTTTIYHENGLKTFKVLRYCVSGHSG